MRHRCRCLTDVTPSKGHLRIEGFRLFASLSDGEKNRKKEKAAGEGLFSFVISGLRFGPRDAFVDDQWDIVPHFVSPSWEGARRCTCHLPSELCGTRTPEHGFGVINDVCIPMQKVFQTSAEFRTCPSQDGLRTAVDRSIHATFQSVERGRMSQIPLPSKGSSTASGWDQAAARCDYPLRHFSNTASLSVTRVISLRGMRQSASLEPQVRGNQTNCRLRKQSTGDLYQD